jgi:pilus assembly protein Flp/PilA
MGGFLRPSQTRSAVASRRIFSTETGMNWIAKRFIQDDAGATAIEYALILAIIGMGVISGVTGVGTVVRTMYEGIGAAWPS